MDCIASGDEACPDERGKWVYAMALPIVRVDNANAVRAGLRELPKGASFLHVYGLTAKDRVRVAEQVANLDWEAALVVS